MDCPGSRSCLSQRQCQWSARLEEALQVKKPTPPIISFMVDAEPLEIRLEKWNRRLRNLERKVAAMQGDPPPSAEEDETYVKLRGHKRDIQRPALIVLDEQLASSPHLPPQGD